MPTARKTTRTQKCHYVFMKGAHHIRGSCGASRERKRRRSTSSDEIISSTRKRQKNEDSPIGSTNDCNMWDVLLSTQYTPQTLTLSADCRSLNDDIASPDLDLSNQNLSSESVYENWNIPAAALSLHSIPKDPEAKYADTRQPSAVKQLFDFAEQGGCGAGLSYNHVRETDHLAGFFGATLYREAFLL